jgi:hypothetical protein
VLFGTPARPLDEFKQIYAHLTHLPNLAKRIKTLARSLDSARKGDPS